MILVDTLIPGTTYVALRGLSEEIFLVTDVAEHPDGVNHWVQLDKRCRWSVSDNFVAFECIRAVFESV